MGYYTIISEISGELVTRLRKGLHPLIPDPDEIGVLSNVNNPSTYKVGVYLYDIIPIDNMKYGNVIEMRQKIAVALNYIIVLASGSSMGMNALEEHKIIGKIIETFYTQCTISNDKSFFTETDLPATINMQNIPLNDRIQLQTHIKELAGNLFYQISPIIIESEIKHQEAERVISFGG